MPSSLLNQSALVMSYLLVIIALWISATRTLTSMVRLYQAQALVLTVVVLITAFEPGRRLLALGLVAILPFTLAVIVPPLLARATFDSTSSRSPAHGSGAVGLRGIRAAQRQALDEAELTWLQHGGSRLPVSLSTAIDMFLIAVAVLVAYRLSGGAETTSVAPSLAVSIALLLQGLFTMINKNDIVSQIIGLLVVDQGLFLAAVRVAPAALAVFFVLSLFLYVLVTLTILLWVLPGLHRTSASIEVAGNAELRG
jgi:hydrogenase-4 membrane subunit HyfE